VPITQVVFFRESDGSVPFAEWFARLPRHAKDQCLAKVTLLRGQGHELRRPAAENLGGGIYELRAKSNNVNYRMLYFFEGRIAVLSHGFSKQRARVPQKEIDLAMKRMSQFRADPKGHTFQE
jgi:phage-related protein